MIGSVVAVSAKAAHGVNKPNQTSIRLIAGEGVEGDAHRGRTVKHRSRVARNPEQPNWRQVHLIHAELFAELAGRGFTISPGLMGENVTTTDIDLLNLPIGARLRLGDHAVVELTGLRNPCLQLEEIQTGLLEACVERSAVGLIRKAGVMAIVIAGGDVRPGDIIQVEMPDPPGRPLAPV